MAKPRTQRSAVQQSPESPFIAPDALVALLEVMARHDVSELTHVRGEGAARERLTIRRGVAHIAVPTSAGAATHVAHATPTHTTHAAPPAATPPAAAPVAEEGVVFVTSPLVGTFYRAPGPDAAPFVEVGARIRPGQRVCIVEAMKLMNEIEAEIEGTILEILVENGKPVEYGQKLFRVRKG